ncbi:hypothetical protein TNCV_3002611 [Trichonephila clavipes]|nr:hypothetical protein TNCV_3002611 [Trichonephila clavipes]
MKYGEIPTTYGVRTGEDYRSSRRRIFLSRNRSSCATEQFHSDTSLEADHRRVPNNSKNWQWTTEVTSARDDRHLLGMAINDRTASSRQLAAHSNRYVLKVLQPEVITFLQGILGAIFQQDNVRQHVAKTVRDFCSAQHMQRLHWSVYSPGILRIEHLWNMVGRRLDRDSRPEASKDELLLRVQATLNSLPQAEIQNLFDSMPRRIAAYFET